MKRLAFVTIVLIVVASTTGCRRGLRLWGLRGAPCMPTCSPVPGNAGQTAPGMGMGMGVMPGMPSPTAVPPQPCCPVTVPMQSYSQGIDCGCPPGGTSMPYTQGYMGAGCDGVTGIGSEVPVSDTGFDIRPGEYLSPGTAPASVAPTLPN